MCFLQRDLANMLNRYPRMLLTKKTLVSQTSRFCREIMGMTQEQIHAFVKRSPSVLNQDIFKVFFP